MSGVVLDVNDDHGALLKERGYHSVARMLVKEAGDPRQAPDDLFGLVVRSDNGRTIRKYACIDKASTLISLVYFRELGHQLRPDLHKIAAKRIATACTWYGVSPPADLLKAADVSGTPLAPNTPKPASIGARRRELEKGLQAIRPHPETGARAKMGEQKTAGRYADVYGKRFPLDSVTDVMQANSYMGKYAAEIEPRLRRRMAGEISKRAVELGIPVSKVVEDLTEVKLSSANAIRGHLEVRRSFYGPESEAGRLFHGLMDKIGSMRPAVLAETIAQIDEAHEGHHHWGTEIPEPWDVVFTKRADAKDPHTYSYDFGDKRVSGDDLIRLSRMGRQQLVARFDKEFADQFTADPVGFFDHLPTPEKRVLMNMAHDSYSPPAMSVLSS